MAAERGGETCPSPGGGPAEGCPQRVGRRRTPAGTGIGPPPPFPARSAFPPRGGLRGLRPVPAAPAAPLPPAPRLRPPGPPRPARGLQRRRDWRGRRPMGGGGGRARATLERGGGAARGAPGRPRDTGTPSPRGLGHPPVGRGHGPCRIARASCVELGQSCPCAAQPGCSPNSRWKTLDAPSWAFFPLWIWGFFFKVTEFLKFLCKWCNSACFSEGNGRCLQSPFFRSLKKKKSWPVGKTVGSLLLPLFPVINASH